MNAGGQGRQPRPQAGQDRGHDGCHQQPPDSGRHHLGHENRQGVVGNAHEGRLPRVNGKVGVKAEAQQRKEQAQRLEEQAVSPERLFGFLHRFGGEIGLKHHLIRTGAGQITHHPQTEPAHHRQFLGGVEQGRRRPLPGRGRDLHGPSHPAHLGDGGDHHHRHTAQDHEKLHHVGPDDGVHASRHGEEHPDDPHQQNGPQDSPALRGPAQHGGDHQGSRINHAGHPHDPGRHEKQRGKSAHPVVEPLFQVLIGGGEAQAKENLGIKSDDRRNDQKDSQVLQTDPDGSIFTIDPAGDPQKGVGAEQGHKHAEGNGPLTHGTAGQEVILLAVHLAGMVEGDGRQADQIQDQYGAVQKAHALQDGG